MGAEQSSNRPTGSRDPGVVHKTCYYELLSIERTATEEEIKKAYRRKALELHPDRNLHDTETATRKFAEVQTAYEILSDPQERAWYDSHRDAILRGENGPEDAEGDDSSPRYYNDVRLTPAEELFSLIGRFNSSIPFDDSPTGFFGILDATFAQLALEEEAACSWDGQDVPVQYPPFGKASDNFDTVARPFYRDWSNFATKKSFRWKDKYRLSDAPDRAVRRLMEKENKKARELGAREFNDAVRSLVAFVRKRDPRYVPNLQSESERQKILRDSAAAQAARQRAANQEKLAASYVAPEWAQSRPGDAADEYAGGFSSDAESEVREEIECVVCDKTFKSEKQFEAHEKSKKHIKALQQLKRQMKKENKDWNLDAEPKPAPQPEPELEAEPEPEPEPTQDIKAEEPEEEATSEQEPEDEKPHQSDSDDDDNDEYAPREVVERRFQTAGDEPDDLTAELDALDLKEDQTPTPPGKKVGKAKAKRDKKAARAAEQSDTAASCKICHDTFSSNTKLHQHLRSAHPMPSGKTTKAGSKKKRN